MPVSLASLDFAVVREHYLLRERTHQRLRRLFDDGSIHEYVQLALGISDSAGNYSAAEHRGMAGKILVDSSEERIFELAGAINVCPSPHHFPKLIYAQGVPNVKISIGSEIGTMLNPNKFWIGNKRTIWTYLLMKQKWNESRANTELAMYHGHERDSQMSYELWSYIYLAMEERMIELGELASAEAQAQGVPPGILRFLWPDAVCTCLFDEIAKK